jgi:hypothetical protein
MITSSINQSWAVSDKIRNRYGNTWADIDFLINTKISTEVFQEDPMTVTVGILHAAGSKIKFSYKDLISYAKSVSELAAAYTKYKTDTFTVDIKTYTLSLSAHEITRVSETLNDALVTIKRKYELGLYL